MERFRRQWLGGIVDYYAGTATQVIFFPMPHTVLPKQDHPVGARCGFIAAQARRPGVSVVPADQFTALLEPRFFYDIRHFNAEGQRRFSRELGKVLLAHLASKAETPPLACQQQLADGPAQPDPRPLSVLVSDVFRSRKVF